MNRLAVIVLGGWLAAVSAMAQTVEFPLGWYSFEEIAKKLSVAGKKVECAPELRQKVALIHLKPRNWDEARTLIQQALDLRISRVSRDGSRWKLSRDPKVVETERKRRQQLAHYLEKRLQREHELMQQLLNKNLTDEQWLQLLMQEQPDALESMDAQQREQLIKRAQEVIRFARQMPFEAFFRSWRAIARLRKAFDESIRYRDISREEYSQHVAQFLKQNPLESFGIDPEVLRWAKQAAQQEIPTEFTGGSPLGALEDPEAKQLLALQLLDEVGKAYLEIWSYSLMASQMRPALSVLEALEQGVVAQEYTVAVPPEAAAQCLNDAEGKIVPLGATQPIPMRVLGVIRWSPRGSCSRRIRILPDPQWQVKTPSELSQRTSLYLSPKGVQRIFEAMDRSLLEAYERAYQQHQALMREAVLHRPLKQKPGRHEHLLRWLAAWAREHQQEIVVEMDVSMLLLEPLEGNTLKQVLEQLEQPSLFQQRPLLLERLGNVWVLRNWMVFVDRVVDYPFAALKQLAYSEHKYADWVRFYQQTTTEQIAWVFWVEPDVGTQGIFHPKGSSFLLGDYDVVMAWVVVAILQSLPEQERARLLSKDEEETVEIPLSRLDPRALLSLTAALQAIGRKQIGYHPWRELLLSPDLPRELASKVILQKDSEWALVIPRDPSEPPERILYGAFSLNGQPLRRNQEEAEP